MSRDINQLHPELQQKIATLIDLCLQNGLQIGISECYRTIEEQNALYAKGRTESGNIVTNAKGSDYSSQHQWKIACDFYRNDGSGAFNDNDGFFAKVGNLAKGIGLAWGGDWTTPVDKPHLYLPQWGNTPSILKQQYGNPNNFFATFGGQQESTIKTSKPQIPQSNPTILELQQALNADGYTDENGNRLVEDGRDGKHTRSALKKVCLKVGSRGKMVVFVQRRTGASPDGKYGQQSKNSTIAYQALKGLTQDGKAGYNTISSML